MPPFIPGIELSRRFYWEAVRPIVDQHHPNLPHAAAIIGAGSDVLGFDTAMSMDHGWGPTVTLFVRDEDEHLGESIREAMADNLPREFYGYPTHFNETPGEPGTAVMRLTAEGLLNHHVFVTTVRAFAWRQLAYNVAEPLAAADWLTFPSEKLLEVTAGAVHYDDVGELTELRSRFTDYPHDVWLYLLASGWTRIGQEEHLMPRAGYVGDELGSALIGSRLIRDVMSLCFLMEKQYAPYPKWFGTAFQQLNSSKELLPTLRRAQQAETWTERETALCEAYETLARMHNALGITDKMHERVSEFHNRPFKVINGDVFADAICSQITEPDVRRLTSWRRIGNIDQFSDSTDLRCGVYLRPVLQSLYIESNWASSLLALSGRPDPN